jgi:S1-C subfamily serine protease
MKAILCALLFTCALPCSAADPVIVKAAKPCVVAVLNADGTIRAAGCLVSADGYIATCRHVVRAAQTVQVRLLDGTEYTATVVQTDEATELALLKIDVTAQPFLKLAKAVAEGETVLAIGHPFGHLSWTATRGIVSAVDRELLIPTGTTLQHLIQTDASINRGNSGGPLLNARGELVGIVAALRSDARGIAYAVGLDAVRALLAKPKE